MKELYNRITQYANEKIGKDRSIDSILKHLKVEVSELRRAVESLQCCTGDMKDVGHESADIIFLVMGLWDRLGEDYSTLKQFMEEKMDEVKSRNYGQHIDGTMRHLRQYRVECDRKRDEFGSNNAFYFFRIDLNGSGYGNCDFKEFLFQKTKLQWRWVIVNGATQYETSIQDDQGTECSIVFHLNLTFNVPENGFIKAVE